MDNRMDMAGRVCIVTGANSGIGKATAVALAKLNATVVLACRNAARGQAALAEVKAASGNDSAELLLIDLASQRSIRQSVADVQAKYSRLHVLINNAANFDHALRKPVLTEDGLETIFATNHLGPFLMTNLLLDMLQASAPARIINVASKGLLTFPGLSVEFDNLNGEKKFSTTHAYYHSKIAQVMFTYDLAKRLAGTGITVNCIRVTNVALEADRLTGLPGWMRAMYAVKRRFSITPEKMAETYVYLAASPVVESVTGKYWDENNRPVSSSKKSLDEAVWERLWRVSEELTQLKPSPFANATPVVGQAHA
jgi:NAD(P)-dependent dehydrogenase (short-subunit alcohol dehydrogenase family)